MLAPQPNMIMVRPNGITRPDDFQASMPVCTDARQFVLRAPPVADGEVEDRAEDHHGEEDRHGQQKIQQMVHFGRDRGRLFRK